MSVVRLQFNKSCFIRWWIWTYSFGQCSWFLHTIVVCCGTFAREQCTFEIVVLGTLHRVAAHLMENPLTLQPTGPGGGGYLRTSSSSSCSRLLSLPFPEYQIMSCFPQWSVVCMPTGTLSPPSPITETTQKTTVTQHNQCPWISLREIISSQQYNLWLRVLFVPTGTFSPHLHPSQKQLIGHWWLFHW